MLLYGIVQIIMILLAAPLVSGVIKKVKALSQKRKGAPLLQMYFDLYKLVKKSVVVSDQSSWIFKATPYIVLSTALAAAVLVPVTTRLVPLSLPGDMIMVVSLLGLGRFFMMLAGLDTASTFGGMGASREAMISSLIEPSMLVSLFALGLFSHSTSIPAIMAEAQKAEGTLIQPLFIMVFLAMLVIFLAETSRIPVDDPATHLELTMVHEAMLLEYSGRHLALMELGGAIRQLILITLMINIFLPHDQWIMMAGAGGLGLSLLVYLIKVILFSLLIGAIEVGMVKFRFFSVPNLAALAFILSLLGFLQYFALGR